MFESGLGALSSYGRLVALDCNVHRVSYWGRSFIMSVAVDMIFYHILAAVDCRHFCISLAFN